ILQVFEIDDLRKSLWIGTYQGVQQAYYFPNKYTENSTIVAGGVTEYPVVLRLEEMYLIRAESLAQLNRLEESRNDLNKIRSRANLSPNSTTSKDQLIEDILKERRVEFLMEYGHRFFDL